jgi:hypothetical protein
MKAAVVSDEGCGKAIHSIASISRLSTKKWVKPYMHPVPKHQT